MKLDVSDIDARSYRHAEGLNRPIEVLVIERVLIVPHAGTWSGHFVAHEPDPIVAVSRFDLIYRGAAVQAIMAGCSRTVEPTGLKLNG